MKVRETHNIELYLGSINEETKDPISYEDLVREVQLFQDDQLYIVPVCITSIEFVCGSEYREKGWRISTINYPRINRTPKQLNSFIMNIATVLCATMKQNRITVVGASNTVMVER